MGLFLRKAKPVDTERAWAYGYTGASHNCNPYNRRSQPAAQRYYQWLRAWQEGRRKRITEQAKRRVA